MTQIQTAMERLRRRYPQLQQKINELADAMAVGTGQRFAVRGEIKQQIGAWRGYVSVYAPGLLDPERQTFPVVSDELANEKVRPLERGEDPRRAQPFASKAAAQAALDKAIADAIRSMEAACELSDELAHYRSL